MAHDGLFSKALVSIIVTLWVGLVGFNWAGYYILEYGMPTFAMASEPEDVLFLGPPVPEPFVGPRVPEPPPKAAPVPVVALGPAFFTLKPEGPEPKPAAPPKAPEPVLVLGPSFFPLAPPEPEPAAESPVQEPEAEEPPPVEEAVEPEPEPEPSPATASEPEKPVPPAADLGERKQYGAFANPDNAERLAEELKASGQEISIEPIETDQGTLYRVRAEEPPAEPEPSPPPAPVEEAPPLEEIPVQDEATL